MAARSRGGGWTGLLLGALLVLAVGVAWLVWSRQVVAPAPLTMDVRLPMTPGLPAPTPMPNPQPLPGPTPGRP